MSSQELGMRAGVSPALVRKDLAWFGEFGKQGVGYEVQFLKEQLRKILHLNKPIHMALVGVGSLGRALARYNRGRFAENPAFTMKLLALFDIDPAIVGKEVDGLPVFHSADIPVKVPELKIQLGIITVPAAAAQEITDALVGAGVKALLNFAPVKLKVPAGVHVVNSDVTLELQRLAYYIEQ